MGHDDTWKLSQYGPLFLTCPHSIKYRFDRVTNTICNAKQLRVPYQEMLVNNGKLNVNHLQCYWFY